jgi:hypothetical protein
LCSGNVISDEGILSFAGMKPCHQQKTTRESWSMYQWNTIARSGDDLLAVGQCLSSTNIDKVGSITTSETTFRAGVRFGLDLSSSNVSDILPCILRSSLQRRSLKTSIRSISLSRRSCIISTPITTIRTSILALIRTRRSTPGPGSTSGSRGPSVRGGSCSVVSCRGFCGGNDDISVGSVILVSFSSDFTDISKSF